MPSIAALDWKADALIDLDEVETEADDPDWDDVAILIGSEIVRHVRAAVRDKLSYTCVGPSPFAQRLAHHADRLMLRCSRPE